MRLSLLILLFPIAALAAEIPAGFPSSSLWLSKLSPTIGEEITIHTVVYNSSDAPISGSVVFTDKDAVLGTKSFQIPTGATQVISQTWKAVEGEHEFSAHLDGVSGASDTLSSTAAAKVSLTIEPPPPPPPAPEPVSSEPETPTLADTLASSSPAVSEVTSSTFAVAEGIRASALVALERIASSTTKGEVLAAEDHATTPEENVAKSFDIGATIQNMWQALLGVLLLIFRSPILFYVFVAFVLFFLLSFVRAMLTDRKDRE